MPTPARYAVTASLAGFVLAGLPAAAQPLLTLTAADGASSATIAPGDTLALDLGLTFSADDLMGDTAAGGVGFGLAFEGIGDTPGGVLTLTGIDNTGGPFDDVNVRLPLVLDPISPDDIELIAVATDGAAPGTVNLGTLFFATSLDLAEGTYEIGADLTQPANLVTFNTFATIPDVPLAPFALNVVVPEPATAALVAGLVGGGLLRRRR